MRPYFPLSPIGIGTRDVECLSSFLHRIAVAHGVTRYQFISHLQRWWAAASGEHLPRCEELRWDGYSPNVAIALTALRHALGQTLDGTTLIALRHACAGNCIGSIKHERSWCPRCFEEDIAAGRPAYDRLLWRIQGMERCSTHRLRLFHVCGHCGSGQTRDRAQVEMHVCSLCGESLSTPLHKRDFIAEPSFGEAQTECLVENLASLSEVAENPLRKFFSRVDVTDRELFKEVGDIFHARHHPTRPQLTSLVAVATFFNVDMVQLLIEPEEAATQATLRIGNATPHRMRRPSSHLRKARTLWFKSQLVEAIAAGPPYASTAEFCRTRDYSVTAARNSFPNLTSELSEKHLAWSNAVAKMHLKDATIALKRLNASRDQLTLKSFTRLIARESGAPLHMVRKLIDSKKGA